MRRAKLESLAAHPDWALPASLPPAWTRLKDVQFVENDAVVTGCLFRRRDGLTVLVSAEVHEDDRRWAHASLSKKGQLPTWQDLKVVKNLFFGPDKLVMQVLPPQDEYVNLHETTLHLWHCIDEPQIVPMAATMRC